jgi:hypothetical protein
MSKCRAKHAKASRDACGAVGCYVLRDAVLCFNCSARPSTRRLAVHGPCARKESLSCDQRWLATSSQLLASMLGSEHDELRDDTPLDSAYFRVGAANHEYSCDSLSAACRVRTSQTLCTLMSRARLERGWNYHIPCSNQIGR